MSWHESAACRGKPIEWFFPDTHRVHVEALQTCSGCPVRTDCAHHAETTPEDHGIWGGVVLGGPSRPVRRAHRMTNRDRVLAAVTAHPTRWFSAQQMAQHTGITSLDSIRYLLRDLTRAGLLDRRGESAGGYSYRLRGTSVEHRDANGHDASAITTRGHKTAVA